MFHGVDQHVPALNGEVYDVKGVFLCLHLHRTGMAVTGFIVVRWCGCYGGTE